MASAKDRDGSMSPVEDSSDSDSDSEQRVCDNIRDNGPEDFARNEYFPLRKQYIHMRRRVRALQKKIRALQKKIRALLGNT